MESLFLLIPIAIVFVIIAVCLFMWSVKSGQFEDLDTEGKRILFDSDTRSKKTKQAQSEGGEHSNSTQKSGTESAQTKREQQKSRVK